MRKAKMTKLKKIELAYACDEDWNKMTPVERGRHCAACQKTVVNFMAMSDEQVIAFYSNKAHAQTCGNFRLGQLEHINKTLALDAPKTKSTSYLKPILASVLLSSSACSDETPQEKVRVNTTSISVSEKEHSIIEAKNETHDENSLEATKKRQFERPISTKKDTITLDTVHLDLETHVTVARMMGTVQVLGHNEDRTAGVPLMHYEEIPKKGRISTFFRRLFKRKKG
jgi:hypothetical protein